MLPTATAEHTWFCSHSCRIKTRCQQAHCSVQVDICKQDTKASTCAPEPCLPHLLLQHLLLLRPAQQTQQHLLHRLDPHVQRLRCKPSRRWLWLKLQLLRCWLTVSESIRVVLGLLLGKRCCLVQQQLLLRVRRMHSGVPAAGGAGAAACESLQGLRQLPRNPFVPPAGIGLDLACLATESEPACLLC